MNRQEAARLYDSFVQKDMDRDEFIKQAVALTDPVQMQVDLNVELRGRYAKRAIDNRLREGHADG